MEMQRVYLSGIKSVQHEIFSWFYSQHTKSENKIELKIAGINTMDSYVNFPV